jgi:hypothetical protein
MQGSNTKIRFGVLDAVILIVVLALIVTLVFRFTTDLRLFTYDTEKYAITVRGEGLQNTSVGMIAISDPIYFDNGDYLGYISTSPTVTPKMVYELGSDGSLTPAYYPDNTLVDLTTVIECDLVTSDGMIMTQSGVHLAVGVVLQLHTQTVDLDVEIISIVKIEP